MTFLEVSRRASEFQLDSNFAAWARTIAKFKVLALTRDKQRAASRLADDVVEALMPAAPPEVDDARHLAVIELLRKCLERLAPAARELVRLRYFGEHRPEGMARIRSQSVNAIDVTLSRARLAVEAMHARGIVHGAIHGRNIIIDSGGRLKLTHVSPLLYSDPMHDLNSVATLFNELAIARGEAGWTLGALAEEAIKPDGTLRQLNSRTAALIDARRDIVSETAERQADALRRRGSRLGAALAVGLAILLAAGIRHIVIENTPKSPLPPRAGGDGGVKDFVTFRIVRLGYRTTIT